MIPQSKGKIFPAQERGITNTGWFKSNNTFNYGLYRHKHKSTFESLYVLNDDVLAADRFITLTAEEDSNLVLIPVIGALQYFDSTGTDTC